MLPDNTNMDKATDHSFTYDYEKIDEESSYANSKGYFFLITKCLAVSSDALVNKDVIKEKDSLYLLRRLLIGYLKEAEITQMEIDFNQVENLIIQYQNCISQKLDYKAQKIYVEVRKILNKIGDLLSKKMHDSNLYTLLKEKGNPLYA